MPTQEERKAATRARLVAAAAELFAAHGVDGVSVDAVGEAAGRTSGSIYAHFGSKQGLLMAVLEHWNDSMLTLLQADVAVAASPAGQVAAVWAHVAQVDDATGLRTLLEHELWLRALRDPEVAEAVRAGDAEGRRRSASQLTGWSGRVGARPVAPAAGLAVLVKALLVGLSVQYRLDPSAVPDELVLTGMGALLGLELLPDGPSPDLYSPPAPDEVGPIPTGGTREH